MQYLKTLFQKYLYLIPIVAITQFPGTVDARDDASKQPIADAMATETAQAFTGVKFYFGDQPYGEAKRKIGNFTSKKTTNAFGKSDYDACQWAFLSAVKSFYERALREGGNAVVNLKSITTGEPFSSATEFECRAGHVVAKVYLSGDVVELN